MDWLQKPSLMIWEEIWKNVAGSSLDEQNQGAKSLTWEAGSMFNMTVTNIELVGAWCVLGEKILVKKAAVNGRALW